MKQFVLVMFLIAFLLRTPLKQMQLVCLAAW